MSVIEGLKVWALKEKQYVEKEQLDAPEKSTLLIKYLTGRIVTFNRLLKKIEELEASNDHEHSYKPYCKEGCDNFKGCQHILYGKCECGLEIVISAPPAYWKPKEAREGQG